jgi:hypothetical protein
MFQGKGGRKKRRLRLFDYVKLEEEGEVRQGVVAFIQNYIKKNNQRKP